MSRKPHFLPDLNLSEVIGELRWCEKMSGTRLVRPVDEVYVGPVGGRGDSHVHVLGSLDNLPMKP